MLPDLTFPIKGIAINPLMDNLVQLNLVEGGINERQQFALGINFHVYDLFVKSGQKIDYRGRDGHQRMIQDAFNFAGCNPAITRHGDLAAAHLAVDYHDCQKRLADAGQPALPNQVSDLLGMCADLAVFPPRDEKRILLLLDYLSKKPA
jgi:hypothetical protein